MAKLQNTLVAGTGAITPSSGTEGQRPSDTIVSFTSTGSTTWTCPTGITSVEVLVVAGGGAGGTSNAAGGGAGGLVYRPVYPVTPTTVYTVVVGAGNTNPIRATVDSPTYKGGNSQFDALIGLGGGNGGGDDYPGVPGGSGGGSADNPGMLGGTATQPTSASGGYGFPGGNTVSYNNDGGTGGGGAGRAGRHHGETPSYDGGTGLLFDISGTATFYAGGGGGFRRDVTGYAPPQGSGNPVSGGSGRSGAGGRGGGGNADANGVAGGTNTGGGGGGSGPGTGGNGGPGIVVLRYNTDIGGSSVGSTRYNSTLARLEIRQEGRWIPVNKLIQTFNSGGTFSVPTGVQIVDVLVVAGGGGGGQDVGGGGGGGGVVEAFDFPVTPGSSVPVTVGSGGRGASSGGYPSANGEPGGNSTFGPLTALGGGGGGVWSSNNAQGGGSGGGAGATPGAWDSFGGDGNQPSQSNQYARNYGNPGGRSAAGNGPLYGRGAGGGGAGEPGHPARGHTGWGDGGDGIASTISGSTALYGGGGGGTNDQGTLSTYGGRGGGGKGSINAAPADSQPWMPGTANTGGGGGGGTNNGAPGGSGVVIVRY